MTSCQKTKPRIAVVGDIMLDRYFVGDVERLNPEAPGVVIRVDRENLRPGGAASVAMIASSLGADVTLAGVVGSDAPGSQVQALLEEHGVTPHLWTAEDRPTTTKNRFIVRGQLRPDRFDCETTSGIGCDAAAYLAACPLGDVLLVQDYGKGVCTKRLQRSLISRAREASIPVLVDPARGRDWHDYEGCTLIKANRVEAAEALGVRFSAAPAMMARRLAIRHGCTVVVTAGEFGLWWSDGDRVRRVPAVPVEVRDVCGAGDTVLATLGVVLTTGKALVDGCRAAVRIAARQLKHTGIQAVG
jgi:D-beta-D-heptose 7-phosphate kinase/D-beta-D-heptose 1-phosphate adenosyltransferase